MIKLVKQHLKGITLLLALLAPMLMFLEVCMDLQQPTLMADIVNNGVANGDMQYVLSTGVRMIIYAAIGFVGGAGCCTLACYTSVNMGGVIRSKLYAKIQTLSFAELDEIKTASLITRMTNDVSQVQQMFMMLLRGMTRSPLMFIGCIIMSFLLSPKLAVIFCVILPVLATLIILVITKTIPLYGKMQTNIDSVNTVMRENLLGVRVVKAFTMENRQFDRFSDVNDSLVGVSVKAQSMTFLLMPVSALIMNLSIVAILWFGGNMEISGILETGKIMAFVNYMIQITNSLVMLVNMMVNISRAQVSARRITEVFEKEPSVTGPASPQTPQSFDIEFRNVSFRYGTGEYVLRDVSFSLGQGRKVGVIGTTGCGKSTLVSLIPRLYDASEGCVLIGGLDVRDIPLPLLRSEVGIVLQDSQLFSGSIAENMRYGGLGAGDNDILDALSSADASEFVLRLPDSLDARVEQRGRNFSGGQKQRLNIARTLLQKPKILILDDATSAVDLATDARIQTAVRTSMVDSTIILIAQRISTVIDCDIILVLDQDGRLSSAGNHRHLLDTCDLYRSLALSQLGEEVLSIA